MSTSPLLPAAQQLYTQMQSLAAQAAGRTVATTTENTALSGFAGELHAAVNRINRLQQTASTHSKRFLADDPSVSLNDLMVDMQKASVAFQMGVQVRNKLVAAYKDVMNMQV
ncbi:MAG: flagellar hook-basal body complex protein FliE [Pseudomonas sp.]